MSISIELVLGIIGTITGATGLLIQFLEHLGSRPDLEIEVKRCMHYLGRVKEKETELDSFSFI